MEHDPYAYSPKFTVFSKIIDFSSIRELAPGLLLNTEQSLKENAKKKTKKRGLLCHSCSNPLCKPSTLCSTYLPRAAPVYSTTSTLLF